MKNFISLINNEFSKRLTTFFEPLLAKEWFKKLSSDLGSEFLRLADRLFSDTNPFRPFIFDSLLAFMCFTGVRTVLRISKFLLDGLLSGGAYVLSLGAGFKSKNHLRSSKYRLGGALRSTWLNRTVYCIDVLFSVGQFLSLMVLGSSIGASLLRYNNVDPLLKTILRASLDPLSLFRGIKASPRFWFFQFPMFLSGYSLYSIIQRKRLGAKITVTTTTIVNNYASSDRSLSHKTKFTIDLMGQAAALDDALGWTEFWRDLRDRVGLFYSDYTVWRVLLPRSRPRFNPLQILCSTLCLPFLIIFHSMVFRDPRRRCHLPSVRYVPPVEGQEVSRPVLEEVGGESTFAQTSSDLATLSTVADEERLAVPFREFMDVVEVSPIFNSLLPGNDDFAFRPGHSYFDYLGDLPVAPRSIPFKPVQNNQYFQNFLSLFAPELSNSLAALTRVPPTPFRGGVELFKFIPRDTFDFQSVVERDPAKRTYHELVLEVLGVWFGHRILPYKDPYHVTIDDYTPTSRTHHPGLWARLAGFQDKRGAFPTSQEAACRVYECAVGGNSSLLDNHIWLSLDVVKKQAKRKPDIEMRARKAVIPDLWQSILWKGFKPFFEDLENPLNRTPMAKFELFHRGLKREWRKFCGNNISGEIPGRLFEQLDIKDHGASIQWPVFLIVAEFIAARVEIKGTSNLRYITDLCHEVCFAKIAFSRTHEAWGVLKTKAGLKDGLDYTSQIGALALCVMHAFVLIRNYNLGRINNLSETAKTIISTVHGDNCLRSLPDHLLCLTFRDVESLRFMGECGFQIKPDESAVSDSPYETMYLKESGNFHQMETMSWHLSTVIVGGRLTNHVVGWRHPVEALKGLAYPEKIMSMDRVKVSDITYQAQIVTSLFILHFWNPLTRNILQAYWEYLQSIAGSETPSILVSLDHLRKKLDRFQEGFLDPMILSSRISGSIGHVALCDPVPYPVQELYDLWFQTAPSLSNDYKPLRIGTDHWRAASMPAAYGPPHSERFMKEWLSRRESYTFGGIDSFEDVVSVSAENADRSIPISILRSILPPSPPFPVLSHMDLYNNIYKADSFFDVALVAPVVEETLRRIPYIGDLLHHLIIGWEVYCDIEQGFYWQIPFRIIGHTYLRSLPYPIAIIVHSFQNASCYLYCNMSFYGLLTEGTLHNYGIPLPEPHVGPGYIWSWISRVLWNNPTPVSEDLQNHVYPFQGQPLVMLLKSLFNEGRSVCSPIFEIRNMRRGDTTLWWQAIIHISSWFANS